jgi:hypothetical protein
MSRARLIAGTTLVEVLVVIVVFLVGILAIVQIFPKGFQILLQSRNTSVATALSRDEIERLKSRPEQLPEAIVALYPDGSIDTGRSPLDLGPAGTSILQNGALRIGNVTRGDWMRFSGTNATRHVIGEGRRVPAPRLVGANQLYYGGLLVLQFNPVDTISGTGIQAYGNDLNVRLGDWNPTENRNDYDAFLLNPGGAASLKVSSSRQTPDRPYTYYRVSFSGYVQTPAGYLRRDFTGLRMRVPNTQAGRDANENYPLEEVALQAVVPGTLGAVDPSTVRVRREYEPIPNNSNWSDDDVYEFKILDPQLGVLLFHPSAHAASVPRANGREPLQARVDYDVLDWRVLREEFRFPFGLPAQHRLGVGSLKVGNQVGPDGRTLTGIPNLEGADAPAGLRNAGHARADNLVLQDLDTGGVFLEQPDGEPSTSPSPILTVDKTSGLVAVRDVDGDPSNGTTVHLRLPDGTVRTDVQIDNRAIRALYMVRNEYAVQVLKTPSLYVVADDRPSFGQYYVGGSVAAIGGAQTRIYFPTSDAGRKVTFGEINYRRAGDLSPRQLVSQDFVIQPGSPADPVGLPYIDITSADGNAQRLDVAIDARSLGYAARSVKGASVAVRTVWNPDFFRLDANPDTNMTRLDRWTRGYRRSTNETYLEQGELLR